MVDHKRIERAVTEILYAIGEDPELDGLLDTPARVARMYAEVCSGLLEDPSHHLEKTFDVGHDHDELILVKKSIPVYSLCEHHLLPFIGEAHVGYIPSANGRITGLSKLARIVDGYAKRPQVQERLTTEVADSLQRILEPRGVIVVVEAEHLYVNARRAKASSSTVTSAVHGVFREDMSSRMEALRMIGKILNT